MARIPPKTVTKSDAEVLSNLGKAISSVSCLARIKAIEQVALQRHQVVARLVCENQKSRLAATLFTGPTGVGKTEVAKQLASR